MCYFCLCLFFLPCLKFIFWKKQKQADFALGSLSVLTATVLATQGQILGLLTAWISPEKLVNLNFDVTAISIGALLMFLISILGLSKFYKNDLLASDKIKNATIYTAAISIVSYSYFGLSNITSYFTIFAERHTLIGGDLNNSFYTLLLMTGISTALAMLLRGKNASQ